MALSHELTLGRMVDAAKEHIGKVARKFAGESHIPVTPVIEI
ncbi:MAG: hypothetical protein OEV15_06925 [Gallionella sp.]|nr:hypothetical protein [Gallionella sp.]